MFDGRDYRATFDTTCNELEFTNDPKEIRRKLLHLEWVLEEAIRGVFMLQAFIVSALICFPFAYFGDSREWDWTAKIIGVAIFLACIFVTYWISKFSLWVGISRDLKTRRFGDPHFKGEVRQ